MRPARCRPDGEHLGAVGFLYPSPGLVVEMGARDSRVIRRVRELHRRDRIQPCWRCGGQIDYDATPFTDPAYNLGHRKSVARFPELAAEPSNLAPEHWRCNVTAGDSDVIPLGSLSREW